MRVIGQQKRPLAGARGLRVGSGELADAPADNDHVEVRHGRSVTRPIPPRHIPVPHPGTPGARCGCRKATFMHQAAGKWLSGNVGTADCCCNDSAERPRRGCGVIARSGREVRSALPPHHPVYGRTFPPGVAAVRELVALGRPRADRLSPLPRRRPVAAGAPGIVDALHRAADRRPARARRLAAVRPGRDGDRGGGLPSSRLRRGRYAPRRHRTASRSTSSYRSRQVRSVGYVHVERTERLPAPVLRGGVPLAPLVRSCTDAARRLRSAAEITELFVGSRAAQHVHRDHAVEELHAGSRRGTADSPRRARGCRGRRAVSGRARSQAILAEYRIARSVVERLGVGRRGASPWHRGLLARRGRDGLGDRVERVALHPDAHEYTVRRAAMFTAAGRVYVASKPKMVLNDRSGAADPPRVYTQARAVPPDRSAQTPRSAGSRSTPLADAGKPLS